MKKRDNDESLSSQIQSIYGTEISPVLEDYRLGKITPSNCALKTREEAKKIIKEYYDNEAPQHLKRELYDKLTWVALSKIKDCFEKKSTRTNEEKYEIAAIEALYQTEGDLYI